jgi:hypothetical protein
MIRFDKDMDGSMEPSEHGRWVRYEDVQAQMKALEDALRECIDFVQRHSYRWDGVAGKHPSVIVDEANTLLNVNPPQ